MAGKEKDPKVQQPHFPMLLLVLQWAQQGIKANALKNTTQSLTSLFVLKHLQPYPKLFRIQLLQLLLSSVEEQSCIFQVHSFVLCIQNISIIEFVQHTYLCSFKSPLTHNFPAAASDCFTQFSTSFTQLQNGGCLLGARGKVDQFSRQNCLLPRCSLYFHFFNFL